MADVLIRGMEKMPGNCRECMFAGFGGMRNELNVCMFSGESQSLISHERMSKCPLVPLPEGHGKLGNLDKINASLEAMIEIEHNQRAAPCSWSHAYTEMQSILDDAPTIVPAEGDVNDGA